MYVHTTELARVNEPFLPTQKEYQLSVRIRFSVPTRILARLFTGNKMNLTLGNAMYLLAFLVVIGFVLLKYFTGNHDHWEKKNIVYEKPLIFFGNIKDRMLFKISFHEFYRELYQKFEGHPVAGIFEGRRAKLLLRDPEIIKQVMVRDFDYFMDRPTLNIKRQDPYVAGLLLNLKGKMWKQVRSLMTPAFTSGRMKGMYSMVDKVALQLVDYLDEKKALDEKTSASGNGEFADELEMKDLFGRFTFDVIASCAFGVSCDSQLNPNAEFVRVVSKFDYVSVPMRLVIFLVIMGNVWLTRFVKIHFLNPSALDFLVELLKRTKKERLEGKGTQKSDFLQLMIDAQSEDGKESAACSGVSKPSAQQVLTDDLVISQCLLFLLAGYETSSTLLTFAAYELALYPEIQEKVRMEIKSVLNAHKSLTYEALNEMPYLEMVLLEALRKHPPVARIDRDCVKDYNLVIPATDDEPERHILIEKGTPVSIPVIGLHHDPKYFPDPHRFDPERFSAEEKAKRPAHVFQGFGQGPRGCLGMRFALMSSKLAMARLLMGHKLVCTSRTQVPYKYNKFAMLLKAEGGIWLRVIKIDSF